MLCSLAHQATKPQDSQTPKLEMKLAHNVLQVYTAKVQILQNKLASKVTIALHLPLEPPNIHAQQVLTKIN